jgi:glutaminyl-peptide cyclotransferase
MAHWRVGLEGYWKKLILLLLLFSSACNNNKPRPLTLLPFDGQTAYDLLVKQCDFGPRVPDTPAHDSCRSFLVAELKKHADQVAEQTFEEYLEGLQKRVKLTNIIASFNLQATQRILLCAHWDSRPWADQDPDTSKRRQPVLGANDGASGVAVLLEVAKTLKRAPPPVGVDIIFFDGEDAGLTGQTDTYLAGSRYFARTKDTRFNPMMGILLDMVGGANLQLHQEINSVNYAGAVVDRVWNLAARLGVPEFIPSPKHEVIDDHIPLLNVGIPVIDVIDFGDTPDKCSAQSLEKVGRVVLATVYNP